MVIPSFVKVSVGSQIVMKLCVSVSVEVIVSKMELGLLYYIILLYG